MSWGHDALQADLAAYLRATRDRVVWEDMQLGPVGSPRPDVYTIPKSYTQFKPLAYEIKISVSDFRRDVTAGKWQSYLKYASGVTFAVPAGLITKADIPQGCGLIVRGDDGWRTAKAPTLKVCETLPRDAWLKLMIDGIERQNRQPEQRDFQAWIAQDKLAKKFGQRAAELIHDLARGEEHLALQLDAQRISHQTSLDVQERQLKRERERAALNAKQHAEQISALIMLLEEALELPPGSGAWDVIAALRHAHSRIQRDPEIARLTNIINRIQHMTKDCA